MKQTNSSGAKTVDGSAKNNKGEGQQNPQKGAPGVSKKGGGKHSKDESAGAARNTTKKQSNSI